MEKLKDAMVAFTRAAKTAEAAIPVDQSGSAESKTTITARRNALRGYSASGRAAVGVPDLAVAEVSS